MSASTTISPRRRSGTSQARETFHFVDILPAHTLQLGLKTPRAKIAYGSENLKLPRGRGSLQRIAHADITVLSFSSRSFLARFSDPLFAGVAYKPATAR
ncbi:hypothetical protein VTO73DRAFT_14023 [Trametes versicolor]